MTKQSWESYEEVAVYLLNKFAEHFGVERFEGKQKVQGKAGHLWELEGVGRKTGTEKFILVECRRYDPNKSSRIKQEAAAAIAYRVTQGTDAMAGIIVVPDESVIQSGAKKVFDTEGIHQVILDLGSTTKEFIMKFLDRIAVGVHDEIKVKGRVSIKVMKNDGTIEDIHHSGS